MEFRTRAGNIYVYNPDRNTIILKGINNTKHSSSDDQPVVTFNGRLNPDQIKHKLVILNHLNFEVTDSCNLSCKYCAYGELYSNYDKRQNKKLSFEVSKRIIDYVIDLKKNNPNISYNNDMFISFYGGEPLLNVNLINKIIQYIENILPPNIFLRYNMTTNGVLLSKYMDFLHEKKFSLLISLDGNEYNNRYRRFHNGSDSFSIVYNNIKSLQKKYPYYFKDSVKFNAVLHDLNNEQELVHFFNSEFGKRPMLSQVNDVGINREKLKEFNIFFKKKSQTVDPSLLNEILDTEGFFGTPFLKTLAVFIRQYSNNFFNDYTDLCKKRNADTRISFIPTGTCIPFSKKLFLTVNGKILPCERIGHNFSLGKVTSQKVHLDFDKIAKMYNEIYDSMQAQCSKCLNVRMCSQCIFNINNESGKFTCNNFNTTEKFTKILSNQISLLEQTPKYYKKIVNEYYFR